jgi:hypothetical protein
MNYFFKHIFPKINEVYFAKLEMTGSRLESRERKSKTKKKEEGSQKVKQLIPLPPVCKRLFLFFFFFFYISCKRLFHYLWK